MISNYILIKNKVKNLSLPIAEKYIDKMYNNNLLTVSELKKLDNFIFKTKVLNN